MTLVGVYALVDIADQAIYVGASRDVSRRVREHRSKPWWELVVDVEVYPQPDWELAKYVERGLIARLNPEFNRQSTQPVGHAVNSFMAQMYRSLAEVAR